MAGIRLDYTRFPQVDASGRPYNGAKLYVYRDGTTTPLALYSDRDLANSAANPVIADSAGSFPVRYISEAELLSLRLDSANDATIWTGDEIEPFHGALSQIKANAALATMRRVLRQGANVSLTYDDGSELVYISASGSLSPTGEASGDLTGSYPAPLLAASGVTAGTYGSSGAQVAQLTVDAKGRITNAVNRTLQFADIGGTISGLTTSSFASGVITTDPSFSGATNSQLASALAVKTAIDAAAIGLVLKDPVAVIATANVTRSGEQTIDGVTTSASRVLLAGQTDPTQNGVYVTGAGAWTRASDMDTGAELARATVLVQQGTLYAGSKWTVSETSITLGVTAITLVQTDASTLYTPGFGLGLAGTQFSITQSELVALAAANSVGLVTRTAGGTYARRQLVAPAAGLALTNPAGVLGDITFALANDLAAVEGLSGSGLAVRTGPDTWALRQIAAPAAGIAVSNATGASGDITLALANDLLALENLSGTNTIYYRSGADTWSPVSIGGYLQFSGGTLNLGDANLIAWATKPAPASTLVGVSDAQQLSNKTINANVNTLSNINVSHFAAGVVDPDASAAANSDSRIPSQKAMVSYVANQLAGVTATTLGAQPLSARLTALSTAPTLNYVAIGDGTTWQIVSPSAARTALGVQAALGYTAENLANKGTAGGYASLDGSGKVPSSQLPSNGSYIGAWNASTNSPNVGATSPTSGDYYIVSTAGTTTLGGISSWAVGDQARYNGSAWQKIPSAISVGSIATQDSNNVTITGGTISGVALSSLSAPLALASGGLGVALSDPGAQRLLGWDDASANSMAWVSLSPTLSLIGTTLAVGSTVALKNTAQQIDAVYTYTVAPAFSSSGVKSDTLTNLGFTTDAKSLIGMTFAQMATAIGVSGGGGGSATAGLLAIDNVMTGGPSGLIVRSGTNTSLSRTLAATSGGGLVWANADGVSGNPSVGIADSGVTTAKINNAAVTAAKLASDVGDYVDARTITIVADIAALQALTPPADLKQVYVRAYASGTNVSGSGGYFYYSTSSTATPVAGMIVRPNSISGGNPGRWLRDMGRYDFVSFLWFGADPSYSSDCSAAFDAFVAQVMLWTKPGYIPKGRYKCVSQLVIDMASVRFTGLEIYGDGEGDSIIDMRECLTAPCMKFGVFSGGTLQPDGTYKDRDNDRLRLRDWSVIGEIKGRLVQFGMDDNSDPINLLDLENWGWQNFEEGQYSIGAVFNFIASGDFKLVGNAGSGGYVGGLGRAMICRQMLFVRVSGSVGSAHTSIYFAGGFNYGNSWDAMDLENVQVCVRNASANATTNFFNGGQFSYSAYGVDSTPFTHSFAATVTNGSRTVTGIIDTAELREGQTLAKVSGAGSVPVGVLVSRVVDATSIIISSAATASGSIVLSTDITPGSGLVVEAPSNHPAAPFSRSFVTTSGSATATTPQSTVTCAITQDNPVITMASITGRSAGEAVTGTGIPSECWIESINPTPNASSLYEVTLTHTPTATNATASLTFFVDTNGLVVGRAATAAGGTTFSLAKTCAINSGSSTVTVPNITGLVVGQSVTGTGIPGGTTISAITSSTTIRLSAAASATNAAVSLTFSGAATTIASINSATQVTLAGTASDSGTASFTIAGPDGENEFLRPGSVGSVVRLKGVTNTLTVQNNDGESLMTVQNNDGYGARYRASAGSGAVGDFYYGTNDVLDVINTASGSVTRFQQIGDGYFQWYTNSVLRMQMSSGGLIVVPSMTLSNGGTSSEAFTAAKTFTCNGVATLSGGMTTPKPIKVTGLQGGSLAEGGSVTLDASTHRTIIAPSGALAAATIKLPATSAGDDGMSMHFFVSTYAITALTVTTNDGSPKPVYGAATTAAANTAHRYFYSHAYGGWFAE